MNWKEAIFGALGDVDNAFDRLKWRLDERLGRARNQIVPFNGYGSHDLLTLKGLVIEDKGVQPAGDRDTLWRNLDNMYRRFASVEVPGAVVAATIGGVTQEVRTDSNGYFEVNIIPQTPLTDQTWHPVALSLQEPASTPLLQATGAILIPPPSAAFGVISDIDDTVVISDAPHLLRMARLVFLSNARSRLPFAGVAALYRALQRGVGQQTGNPIFYVSSSPWNLYDLLSDFFALQDIPDGPLFLREWNGSAQEGLPTEHRRHKLGVISRLLTRYPALPFILLGDSGQTDPEIYAEVVLSYPGRIRAVYIRDVSRAAERTAAIAELARTIAAAGSTLLLAADTLTLAQHLAVQGLIAAEALAAVAADKAQDEAPPGDTERLLDSGDD